MKLSPSVKDSPLTSAREVSPETEARGTFPGLRSFDRAPREEILHRAYALWENEGHPEGRALAHWLEAEAEVMSQT